MKPTLVLGGELKKEKRLDRAIKLMQMATKLNSMQVKYIMLRRLLNTQGDITKEN